jgi:hypothetical protein
MHALEVRMLTIGAFKENELNYYGIDGGGGGEGGERC